MAENADPLITKLVNTETLNVHDGIAALTNGILAENTIMQHPDSNGDGTGDIDHIIAPTTITGATNASPIVITAASHGLSLDSFISVQGVVGNTAANGIWKIGAVDTNTITLVNKDGTNSTGNGAYISGGQVFQAFAFVPTSAQNAILTRMTVKISSSTFDGRFYMGLAAALTNGIDIQLRDGTSMVKRLIPSTIKVASGWGDAAGVDARNADGGVGQRTIFNTRWTFPKSFGGNLRVDGRTGQERWFVIVIQDDLTTGGTMDYQDATVHGFLKS